MKKTVWFVIAVFIILALITYFISENTGTQESENLSIIYPYNIIVEVTKKQLSWLQ